MNCEQCNAEIDTGDICSRCADRNAIRVYIIELEERLECGFNDESEVEDLEELIRELEEELK
jgi:hypothetical protein